MHSLPHFILMIKYRYFHWLQTIIFGIQKKTFFAKDGKTYLEGIIFAAFIEVQASVFQHYESYILDKEFAFEMFDEAL